MDSLTQIILGAAVGQASTGKKLGNRAMLWGAIAGTIPDLDIIGNAFMSQIDALAFHRGISHSFFFAIVCAGLLAWYTRTLYRSKIYKNNWYKYFTALLGVSIMIMLAMGIHGIIDLAGGPTASTIGTIVLALIVSYLTYRLYKHYLNKDLDDVSYDYKLWYKLFLWSIITHPILDCFTTYGTQIFAPFSNYRVSFDNISVADPGYTIPFLICLLIAAFLPRKHPRRNWFNWLGITLSSLYMIWTISNKVQVNAILEETLVQEGIEYQRYMTNPSILNNFLWSGTVECDSVYYQGQFSFFDREKKFKLKKVPKNLHLIDGNVHDETVETLKWFANDYVSILRRKDGRLQINDMRYGVTGDLREPEDSYIFSFILVPDNEGKLQLAEGQGGRPDPEERMDLMDDLITRVKGI